MNNLVQMLADKIVDQFDRLGVSTNHNPYSGLMADGANVVTEYPIVAVKVYDDYNDGFYDAVKLLHLLKNVEIASLDSDNDDLNIWSLISSCEI
jgi:hypothetical protein